MGTTNFGNQEIFWDYFSPVTSSEMSKHHQDIIPTGIYKGGRLEKVTDASVKVLALVCQISDGVQQARIKTSTYATIAVSSVTPYVVLRWSWQAVSNWWMDMLAVASSSIQDTDLIVGKCVYSGATLVSFDYGERSTPLSFDRFLKVEELDTPAMRVFVNTGWISYGDSRVLVSGGQSGLITAPTTNPRIDLIYIDSLGDIQIDTGTENPSPSPNSHTGKIVLAEVLVSPSTTSITNDLITDCRPFVNLGAGGSSDIMTAVDYSLMLMGS